MQDFRISVGNSLKDKIGELGFFLQKIADVAMVIEHKHLAQDYPLNTEIDKLNYYFSAYLNSIQSLKDGFQTATGTDYSWSKISPKYGKFIFDCRNATTHDGYHLINAGRGAKSYITGPLRRLDSHGTVIEINPPQSDLLTLCCDITHELLASLRGFINQESANIPVPEEADFIKSVQSSLHNDFIPQEIRGLIKANLQSIESSFKGVKVDVVYKTLDAISSVEKIVASIRT